MSCRRAAAHRGGRRRRASATTAIFFPRARGDARGRTPQGGCPGIAQAQDRHGRLDEKPANPAIPRFGDRPRRRLSPELSSLGTRPRYPPLDAPYEGAARHRSWPRTPLRSRSDAADRPQALDRRVRRVTALITRLNTRAADRLLHGREQGRHLREQGARQRQRHIAGEGVGTPVATRSRAGAPRPGSGRCSRRASGPRHHPPQSDLAHAAARRTADGGRYAPSRQASWRARAPRPSASFSASAWDTSARSSGLKRRPRDPKPRGTGRPIHSRLTPQRI